MAELALAGLVVMGILGGAHLLADWAKRRGTHSKRGAWFFLWLALTVFGVIASPVLISEYGDAAERQHQQPVRPYVPPR
jgi:hypothetical protein